MFHRGQTNNFRTSEAPFGGSFYSFLLRPRFQFLNAGDLLEYVTSKLWALTGVRTNRVDFTLVNVCSPFTRFSHGFCAEPPKAVRPTGTMMVFTFAVSQMQAYDKDPSYRRKIKSENKRVHDNQTTQWSPERGAVDFVSVSVNLNTAHEMGISSPKASELEYLYNLIGAGTKSIMRNQTKYRPIQSDYDDVHESLDLKNVHDRIYSMSMRQLLTTVPYHLWVFNAHVWRRAPNLIPQRMITPAVALYYFMYLRGDIALTARCSNDVGMARLGLKTGKKRGVLGHLAGSILELTQLVKTRGDREFDSRQLLAPAVISALLRTDRATITSGSGYKQELHAEVTALVSHLGAVEQDLGRIFFPPDEVGLTLLTGDLDYIAQLAQVLGLSDPAE